jgi:hypothetical protein
MLSRFTGHRLRLPLVIGLALVALCATAALALASHQVAGAHYKGHIDNYHYNTPISFKVNDKGTEVRLLATDGAPVQNYPDCMQPTLAHGSEPAPISKKGKFKGVIEYSGGGTDILATVVVTGKFHPGGRESGIVTGTFQDPDCNGSAHYSTKAH